MEHSAVRKDDMKNFRFVLFAVLMAMCSYSNASPYQFVAKIYTEGFGRAPEPTAWVYFTDYITQHGCSSNTLSVLLKTIYTSQEFNQLKYSNAAKVISAYRGVLNREPDAGGFHTSLRLLNQGSNISTLIDGLINSPEFSGMVPTICNAPLSYGWGTMPVLTKVSHDNGSTGAAPKNSDELQSLLNQAQQTRSKKVILKKRTVIETSKPIFVPENVTLVTEGEPDRKHYAEMARIVRSSASLSDSLIILEAGSNMNSIWVSGQRNIYGYVSAGTGAPLVACKSCGGVQNNRLENPYAWTTLAPMMGTGLATCNSVIRANLITGYSNTHSMFANGKVTTQFSDGISNSCQNATISDNEIIDASDIGIAVFQAADPWSFPSLTQVSQVFNNTVISAGVPSNAALLFEADISASFSDGQRYSTISGNTFWAAPDSHFDIGIALGGISFMQYQTPYPIGTFPVVKNNTNAGIPTPIQSGIVIEYMQNVTVTGNSLTVQTPSGAGGYTFRCPTGNASNVYFDTVNGASGTVDACPSMGSCSIPASPQFVPFVERCTGHCWNNNTVCY